MFKKNIGKISFFVFNILLLTGGILFIKNKESEKVIENTAASDPDNIQSDITDTQGVEMTPSANLPVSEEKTVENNSAASDVQPNPASSSQSVSAPAPAPSATSSATAKKAKTKTS